MNITVDEIFKYAFVISIEDNKFNQINAIFQKNLLYGLKRFNGFLDPDLSNKKKCSLSHIGIIKMAQCFNLPYVCIFEDDAYPCINIKQKLDLELQAIPENTAFMLLGWCNDIKKEDNYLINQCNGSHAYIVFKTGYDLFIKCYNQISEKHIDRIFFEISKYKKIYCASENLFIQYSSLKSMNNHIGYIYNGKDNKKQPDGFLSINEQIFKQNIDLNEIKNTVIAQFNNINIYKTNNKCILIGNNTSKIKNIYARKYIDLTKYVKIRINTLINNNLISNYGKRTDLFFCEKNYKKNLDAQNKKNLLITDDVIKTFSDLFLISNSFKLSLDFIASVIVSCIFDKIELFGLNLDNFELQILKKLFQENINEITDVHPELILNGHGISNKYYKNKKIIPLVLKKLKIENIQDILSINNNACISNKCIIIGGAETVRLGAFGNYIDTCNKTIIRINTKFTPNGYEKFIGTRTDLIIASSYHINHNIINKSDTDKNISVYLSSDIRKLMQTGKAPLTTGFMTILLCLYLFDEIELLGFGLTDTKQQDGICESFHNAQNKIQLNCKHNINYEHQYIDELIKNPLYKINRIEEIYPEYLF